jgi:hypothetical protein
MCGDIKVTLKIELGKGQPWTEGQCGKGRSAPGEEDADLLLLGAGLRCLGSLSLPSPW